MILMLNPINNFHFMTDEKKKHISDVNDLFSLRKKLNNTNIESLYFQIGEQFFIIKIINNFITNPSF